MFQWTTALVTGAWLLAVGIAMGSHFGTDAYEVLLVALATVVLMLVVIVSAFGVVRWMVNSDVLAPN